MNLYEIILSTVGVFLIFFSLYLLYKGIANEKGDFKIIILNNEISVNTPSLFILVLGVILLLNRIFLLSIGGNILTIEKVINSQQLTKKIQNQINQKANDIVKSIDSGYSKIFVFNDGEIKEPDYLLFYAGEGQQVDLDILAPFSSVNSEPQAFLVIKINNEIVKKGNQDKFELSYDRQITKNIDLILKERIKMGKFIHSITFDVKDKNGNKYFKQYTGKRPLKIQCVVMVRKKI